MKAIMDLIRDMPEHIVWLLIVAVAAGYLYVGKADFEEVVAADENYCHMVEVYKQTDGENGWPAYRGEC